MQTKEDRIKRHYKSLRRKWECRYESAGTAIWMPLARTWKMPIREIKRIVHKHDTT